MSTNENMASTQSGDEDFLITESVGGPRSIVERTVKVDSVRLPETKIAEVERIQISERVIPLPSANGKVK
jgi:hypothetical protein